MASNNTKIIENKKLKIIATFLAGILGSLILVYNFWGELDIMNFNFSIFGTTGVFAFAAMISWIVEKIHYKLLLIFITTVISFLIGMVMWNCYIDLFINHKKRYEI